jgi:hypothetical protein
MVHCGRHNSYPNLVSCNRGSFMNSPASGVLLGRAAKRRNILAPGSPTLPAQPDPPGLSVFGCEH